MIEIASISHVDYQNTTGSTVLKGSAGGRMTATIDFYVHWEIIGSSMSFSGDHITLNDLSDSWYTSGFNVGDIVEVVDTGSNDGQYELIGILNQSVAVFGVVGSGSGSGSGGNVFTSETTTSSSVYGVTPIQGLRFFYNLVKNTDSPYYQSIIDGETQKFETGLNDFTTTPTKQLVAATVNKSWQTGFSSDIALNQVEYLGLGASGVSTGYEQAFRCTLVFYISPVILQSYLDGNNVFTSSLNPEFYQNECLKFVQRWEASFDGVSYYHNSDTGNSSVTNGLNADTGWFDERGNGNVSDYTLTSVSLVDQYSNTVTNIGYNSNTDITAILADANSLLSASTQFEVCLWEMPNESDYQNNTNTMFDNFDVSRLVVSESGGSQSNNNITVSVTVDSTAQCTFSISVTANTSNSGRRYVLFIIAQNASSTDLNSSNIASTLIHQGQRVENIPVDDIFEAPNVIINDHSSNNQNNGFNNYKGWIQDDFLATWEFSVKKSTQDGRKVALGSVDWKIMAVHSTDDQKTFAIDEFLDITVGTNTTRGYTLLPNNTPKNQVKLSSLVPSNTFQNYHLQIGQIIPYEYWKILQNASSDFPSPTQNSNQYQDHPDYRLEIWIIANVFVDRAEYNFRREVNLSSFYYDEYYKCEIVGRIETFLLDGTALGSSISPTANTLVKGVFEGEELFPCIYTPVGSGSGSCSFSSSLSSSNSDSFSSNQIELGCYNFWALLGYDNRTTGGRGVYDLISSIYGANTNSLWIGELGANAKVVQYPYASPPRVEVTAVIDYTKVDTSIENVELTARLGKKPDLLCTTSILATVDGSSYTNSELSGFSSIDLLAFLNGDEGFTSGWTLDSSTGTITFDVVSSGTLKICCGIDSESDSIGSSDFYQNDSLIGLTINDFLLFIDGEEYTTQLGSFNSTTGTISFLSPVSGSVLITFHVSISTGTLSSDNSFTDPTLLGRDINDLLVFVAGEEETTLGATLNSTTGTINFPISQTGDLKIVEIG